LFDSKENEKNLWQKKRRGQIAQAADQMAIVLQPMGAIEQHGPHLPIDTDITSSFTISALAAQQVDEFPVLVLPPIWWGLSPYWMGFAGTLSLRPETMLAVIDDVAGGVAYHGFHKLVLVNGHGGNAGLIEAAATKASKPGLEVAALSYWELIPTFIREVCERDGGDVGHAGELETSTQLYLQSDCVDLTQVSEEQCLDLNPRAPLEGLHPDTLLDVRTRGRPGMGAVYLPPHPEREAPHGVYGFALEGNVEKGEKIINEAATALADFLRKFYNA